MVATGHITTKQMHLREDARHTSLPRNGISIGSAIFAGFTVVTDTQTNQ